MSHRSNEQTDRWREEIDTLGIRLRETAGGLEAAARDWTPPEGGWSLGQVMEHLVIAEGLYLDRIRPLVRGPSASRSDGSPWKRSWVGRLIAKAMSSPRRFKAPRVFEPGPTPRSAVLDTLLAQRTELRTLIGESAGLDWQRIRLPSPVTPLLRLNLGDAYEVMIEHGRRHADQMDRIRAHASFPRT